jgi:hypothetical protein
MALTKKQKTWIIVAIGAVLIIGLRMKGVMILAKIWRPLLITALATVIYLKFRGLFRIDSEHK